MFTGLVLICAVVATGPSPDLCIVQHSPTIYENEIDCITETYDLKNKKFFEPKITNDEGVEVQYELKDFICFNWADKKI